MSERKSHGRSKAGVELTDEVLEQMAREAEAGLDVTKLHRRPGRPAMGSGPAETVPVRLDPELRRAVEERAAAEETTVSEVLREALRRYLGTASHIAEQQRRSRADSPGTPGGFEIYKDDGGQYRWRLLARGGEIIAASNEGYASKSGCLRVIDVVREAVAGTETDALGQSHRR